MELFGLVGASKGLTVASFAPSPVSLILGLVATAAVITMAAGSASKSCPKANPKTAPKNSKSDNHKSKKEQKNSQKEKGPSRQPPRRRKSREAEDISSETGETPVSEHIADRFIRFVRFEGILQMISEHTNIPRDQLVKKGPSKHQDCSSKRGPDYHAAHVIRVGDINPLIQKRNPEDFTLLINIVGHTQVVPRWVNDWHLIGGDIDRFQEEFLEDLMQIDFSGNLTTEISEILIRLKKEFISIIEKWIGRIGDENKREELKKAKKKIHETSIKELFERGKKGYKGEYNFPYTGY